MQAPLCQTNSAAPSLATNFLVPPPQETATAGDNTSLSASTPAFRHNGMTAPNLSPLETSAFIGNRSKQLPARIKLYEFYNAPITKFWAHSVSVTSIMQRTLFVVLLVSVKLDCLRSSFFAEVNG